MNEHRNSPAAKAILAAAMFGISAPLSKLLLQEIPPALVASLLYLGAGIGVLGIQVASRVMHKEKKEARLVKKDLPYVILMVLLDIAAPICLMFGLLGTSAAGVSLLTNFEIVITAIVAAMFFKEPIGRSLCTAIVFITVASILLSFEGKNQLLFSYQSLLVLLGCVCWGIENNCTRMISLKNPLEIVAVKGFGAGAGAFGVSFLMGEHLVSGLFIVLTLLIGFLTYGLSLCLYIQAQRDLGAARTSTYYAVAPFIGVILALCIFKDPLPQFFWIAAALMAAGTYLTVKEVHSHEHIHKTMGHEHRHGHNDGHHQHEHDSNAIGEHVHYHVHDQIVHTHRHKPDMHHSHMH